MPSLIVTPPQKLNDPGSYLLINAEPDDLEMVLRWLQINGNDLIINLYFDAMNNYNWLAEVANLAEYIVVNQLTDTATLGQLEANKSKFTWIGQDQEYKKAIEYFTKNG